MFQDELSDHYNGVQVETTGNDIAQVANSILRLFCTPVLRWPGVPLGGSAAYSLSALTLRDIEVFAQHARASPADEAGGVGVELATASCL